MKVIVEILNRPDGWIAVDLDEDGVFSLSGHEGAELVRIRMSVEDPARPTWRPVWRQEIYQPQPELPELETSGEDRE